MCRFGFLEHQLVHLQEVEVLVLIGLVLCAKHLAAQNTLRLAQAQHCQKAGCSAWPGIVVAAIVMMVASPLSATVRSAAKGAHS